MKWNKAEAEYELEEMIDQHGLYWLIQTIGTVCYVKADFIAENWLINENTPDPLAKVWEKAGLICDGAAEKLLKVSRADFHKK